MAYWTTYAAASSATGRSWHTDFLRGRRIFFAVDGNSGNGMHPYQYVWLSGRKAAHVPQSSVSG